MNARLYDPAVGRFLSPDPYVQAPDFSQNFNRYSYALNNPLKYTDPNGEFWHLIIGALIGGVANLITNWDNCSGFWEYVTAFTVGAGAGATIAATGGSGASIWAMIGVGAGTGAVTSGTNSVIGQTGENFSGLNQVDWKQVGISSAVGAVGGAAGAGAGYAASNMSFLVNGVSSPVLRSAVISPLAAGAGHVAGGTSANLFVGQSLDEAFSNSFKGIGKSMAFGGALGVASTIGVSYANKVNPWTGKPIISKATTVYRVVSEAEYNDIQANGIRVSPDGKGYQDGKLFYPSYEEALRGQSLFQSSYGQKSFIIEATYPQSVINNSYHFSPDGMNAIMINALDLKLSIKIQYK
ncbi:hypothetical protein AGMMS50262_22820 [Bacteroidia bacterium]|nr:hypothetical protein AGMMS50262_22820 [Bacteroidia bacterium]